MKQTLMNRLKYYILFLTVLSIMIFTVVYIRMESCTDPYSYVLPKSNKPQPIRQKLEKDGKQLIDDFISTVEYYRLALQSDTMEWKESHDPANFYSPLAQRETLGDYYVASPLPTATQLRVFVDTILYSKDGNLCFALLIVRTNYTDLKNFQYRSKDCPYDAHAVVGYRENDSMPYTQYPVQAFGIIGMDSYGETKRMIRAQYFRLLKTAVGSYFTVYGGCPYKYGIGDPEFFDESPLFQKYDSTRYNFQMYRKDGEDLEYPIRKASYFTRKGTPN